MKSATIPLSIVAGILIGSVFVFWPCSEDKNERLGERNQETNSNVIEEDKAQSLENVTETSKSNRAIEALSDDSVAENHQSPITLDSEQSTDAKKLEEIRKALEEIVQKPGPDTGDLSIGYNVPGGGFTVRNLSQDIVFRKKGLECVLDESKGFRICKKDGLLAGAYLIEFHPVDGYKTPKLNVVQHSVFGSEILVEYKR